MTTTKFQVGQKVRCVSPAKTQAGRSGSGWKSGHVFTISAVSSINIGESDTCYYGGIDGFGVFSEYLELATQSLDNLEVGDIIVHPDGDEAKVLAVLGDVFLTSGWGDFDSAAETWYTVAESKTWHWTVKQDTPTEEITELSIAELEKRLDLTAGTLRVKKD